MKKDNWMLLACVLFFLSGMLVQKSGLLRRAVYFVHQPDCSTVQAVLDGQCGNAICAYDSSLDDSACLSEKNLPKGLQGDGMGGSEAVSAQ